MEEITFQDSSNGFEGSHRGFKLGSRFDDQHYHANWPDLEQRNFDIRKKNYGDRIAAFGIFAGVVLASIGVVGYYFVGQSGESKADVAAIQARTISQALETYRIDHKGQYPNSLEDLLEKGPDGKGPYLERHDAIIDPWNRPYQYDPTGTENFRSGAIILIADVFTTDPKSGRKVGDFRS